MTGLTSLPRRAATAAALGLVRARAATDAPLPERPTFPPHVGSRRWAWTHYGVMVPDLPAPHRFLACMALVGVTGSRTFDTDHALVDGPRHSATLVTGTAVTAAEAPEDSLRAYSTRRDCDLAPDGRRIRLGDDLTITGTHPHLHVVGRRGELAYDLDLTLTPAVTWFARSPIWEHLSVLSRYRGTLAWRGEVLDVDGTGTFEWARSAGVHALVDRPLPARLKAPADSFAYAVIDLDPDTQLLLSGFGIAGHPMLDAAYLRSTTAPARRWVRGVELEVLDRRDEASVAPDGRAVHLPRRLRWRGPDGLDVTVTLATDLLYGLGSGYVGGIHHEGTVAGRAIAGQGYLELIDRRRG